MRSRDYMTNTEILTNTTITTEEFLNEIHGKEALIYFNVGNKTWTKKPQTYSEAQKKLKWLNQYKNKDVCYIVNSGGSKNCDINRINASFLDWDSGKDPDGNYFSLDIVADKKTEFLSVLQLSPLVPSFVVEDITAWSFEPIKTSTSYSSTAVQCKGIAKSTGVRCRNTKI
jgi:hypothetical protein